MLGTAVRKKLVVVGDGTCGKTCLLISFCKGSFQENYVPTIFENHNSIIEVNGKTVELVLWDTAGQEGYGRLRALSYPDADVILICYSVELPDSLSSVISKWKSEVSHHCPDVRLVLVALKTDLRNDAETISKLRKNNLSPVTYDSGLEAAKKIGAKAYVECSAKLNEGVQQVFETATLVSLMKKKNLKKSHSCQIL